MKLFIKKIDTIHASIKFECKYSRKEISFLDTTVTLENNGTLSTKLYTKATDRNAYLHFNSYHPVNQKENIPFGQFLRAKKICTKIEDREESFKFIENKFKLRGYPLKKLENQRKRANELNRADLLKAGKIRNERKIPFTTTYNTELPRITHVINKHWHLLKTNPEIATAFEDKPVLAFRRNKNLRDILGQTHLSRNRKITAMKPRKEGSCYACLSGAGSQCCSHVISTKTFTSATNKKTFRIRHNLNCRSRNVIYLAYCNLCTKSQYIGKSEPPVHLRINTHRRDVKGPNGGRFDKHFNEPGHEYNKNARYIIIEQVYRQNKMKKMDIRKLLEDREDFWMQQLETIVPKGMNDHLNSNIKNQIRVICS